MFMVDIAFTLISCDEKLHHHSVRLSTFFLSVSLKFLSKPQPNLNTRLGLTIK